MSKWKLLNAVRGFHIRDGSGRVVAYVMSAEDARLMAAAPDLLAACETALVSIEGQWPDQYGWTPDSDAKLIERLRAAIARAKGETQ